MKDIKQIKDRVVNKVVLRDIEGSYDFSNSYFNDISVKIASIREDYFSKAKSYDDTILELKKLSDKIEVS